MRLTLISDLHGHLPSDLPPADLLVIAGDIAPETPPQTQTEWAQQKLKPWLEAQPVKRVLAIAGNHDYWLHQAPPTHLPWTYLLDQPFAFEGVRFFGSPWVPLIGISNYPFTASDEDLARRFAEIPGETEILVVHGPPLGILDQPESDPRASLGSRPLLEALPRLERLGLVVFGHIHGSRGTLERDGVLYVNAAVQNEQLEPVNEPISLSWPLSSA
jgi:Icc-related predicted phosphoesterase